ncbi:SH3 domain-containing protein [Streptomyces sp. TM32]|uniref:SH3 domain-containing protein n=1 Tax=Streptomyces sp. TM32 TaxID=1652669 RepID=UPI00101172BF|nr:SH3 domain-containing protein [Streptomyces sp. TM32]RXS83875.1 SH3 domain-containing protein [Streptomyces sp. TM32]
MTTQDQQSAQEPAEGQALAAAGGLTYPLAPGYRVKVRQGPTTDSPVVRQLAEGARVQIRCQRHGQRVSGPYGTSDIWDNIAPGQYVSDAFVHTGSSGMVAPRCTS